MNLWVRNSDSTAENGHLCTWRLWLQVRTWTAGSYGHDNGGLTEHQSFCTWPFHLAPFSLPSAWWPQGHQTFPCVSGLQEQVLQETGSGSCQILKAWTQWQSVTLAYYISESGHRAPEFRGEGTPTIGRALQNLWTSLVCQNVLGPAPLISLHLCFLSC